MPNFLGSNNSSEKGYFQSGYIDRLFFVNTAMIYKMAIEEEEIAKNNEIRLDNLEKKIDYIISLLEVKENEIRR